MRIYAKGQSASHPGLRTVSLRTCFSATRRRVSREILEGGTGPGLVGQHAKSIMACCRSTPDQHDLDHRVSNGQQDQAGWQTCITWTGCSRVKPGPGPGARRRAAGSSTRSRQHEENRATQGRAREKRLGPQNFVFAKLILPNTWRWSFFPLRISF